MRFSGYPPCIIHGKSLKRFGKFRVLSPLGWSFALVRKATMAPKSLLKTLKYKPQVQLNLDDIPVIIDKEKLSEWVKPKVEVPAPTPHEKLRWAAARELQKADESGQPVEGWAMRIELMKNDGRLWYSEEDKTWHRRGC
jgi:hypothetical protein